MEKNPEKIQKEKKPYKISGFFFGAGMKITWIEMETKSKYEPIFTDRILYKHQSTTQVNPLHYDSVQDVTTSDHKPVWGIWEVKIRPGKDNVPLSGGLFNREVYLEGLKRRSEALHPPSAGKMTCNIQ